MRACPQCTQNGQGEEARGTLISGSTHKVDGPSSESTARPEGVAEAANIGIDTIKGTGFHMYHGGVKSYDLPSDKWTIDFWTKGPYQDTGTWHTVARGNAGDHHGKLRIITDGCRLLMTASWAIDHEPHREPYLVNLARLILFLCTLFFLSGLWSTTQSGGSFGVYSNSNGGFRDAGISHAKLVGDAQWRRVTLVSGGGKTKIFLNGKLEGTSDRSSATEIFPVGCHASNAQCWGNFANFRYFEKSLSDEEVAGMMG